MRIQDSNKLKAVDFFCGAGGMSYGLSLAGVDVLGGIDNNLDCRATYEANIQKAKFLKHNIETLEATHLAQQLKIVKNDPNLIFVGCSPCQFWSKIRTDKTKSQQTAFLLQHFERFIDFFQPAFIVVENVPGLYTNKKNKVLKNFTQFLKKSNYVFADNIINANYYGVPQNRKRYLLIATRLTEEITLPKPIVDKSLRVSSYIGTANGFPEIPAGHYDKTPLLHTASALSALNLRRIQMTRPSGGSRHDWKDDPTLQVPAYVGRDDIFRDVYSRMDWNKPAPTITTRFNSFSNGRFGHPVEDRAISLREGATLQTFPKEFIFHGNRNSIARQIGNAVPPELARRIGHHLIFLSSNG